MNEFSSDAAAINYVSMHMPFRQTDIREHMLLEDGYISRPQLGETGPDVWYLNEMRIGTFDEAIKHCQDRRETREKMIAYLRKSGYQVCHSRKRSWIVSAFFSLMVALVSWGLVIVAGYVAWSVAKHFLGWR